MSRLLIVLLLALVATALAVKVSTRANLRSDSDSDADVEADVDVDVDADAEAHAEVDAEAPHDALDGFVDDQIAKLGGSSNPPMVGAGTGDFSLAGYSFDSQLDLSLKNFQCIFNGIGGKGFIARAWRSNCQFDPIGKKNIATAWAAGADRVDVYMFPKYTCKLSAKEQVDAMLTGLGDAKFSRVWLDVEDGANWDSNNRQGNLDWVVAAVNRLEEKLGRERVGIYSSAVMWQNVFGTGSVASSPAARALAKYPMWYAQYDNKPSFNRYTKFANWEKPFLKQYQGDVKVCNLQIDVNWRPNEAGPVNPTGPAPAQTCSSGGRSGKCIDRTTQTCGTSTVPGLCSGTTTICCLNQASAPASTLPCSSAGKSGSCIDVTKSPCGSGSIAHGLCPGDDNVVCCLNSAPRIGAGVAIIGTNVGVYLSQPFANATKAELLAASINLAAPPKVGAAQACSSSGRMGTCIETKTTQCSTSTVPGLCAGATTICCLNAQTTGGSSSAVDFSKLAGKVPAAVLSVLPDIATRYSINTKLRLAHFLSQVATESGSFTVTSENLNYSGPRLMEVFKKYFTTATANAAAYKPQVIGNTVYGNRMGNGNFASGDGYKYRGRGYIQLTGKDAYKSYGTFRGIDAVGNPDQVAGPYALDSAAWFFGKFKTRLLATCDRGSSAAVIEAVSAIVNGGDNGLPERKAYFNKFWAALQ